MTKTDPRNLSFPSAVDYRRRTIRRPLKILGLGCRPNQEGKPNHAQKNEKSTYSLRLGPWAKLSAYNSFIPTLEFQPIIRYWGLLP